MAVSILKKPVRAPERGAADYLGPAVVAEVDAQQLRVELPGGETVAAQMALAFPYEPVVGDIVLVIGGAGRHYMIGVLQGAGRTVLSLPGEVCLHAQGGALRLSGEAGVSIEGPEVDIQAGKLRMMAGAAVQKFTSLCQRVSDLFSMRAGQSHSLVEGSSYAQAKRTAIVTEETVTINGKAVHLG